jgi:hypothetical protein
MWRKQQIDDISRLVPEEECDSVSHGDSLEGRDETGKAFCFLVAGEASTQTTRLRARVSHKES